MGSSAAKETSFTREAYHAGSWYDDDSVALDAQLNGYLAQTNRNNSNNSNSRLRGLIVPHAGYSYSGPTAAYAYQTLLDELLSSKTTTRGGGGEEGENDNDDGGCCCGPRMIETILVLHPSHHVYLSGCAVSGATELATPLGNLTVDRQLRHEILSLSTANFTVMTQDEDEKEHSGEMQYPFLAKVLHDAQRTDKKIKVLPIMCGSLSNAKEAAFGRALQEIIARPSICTVVSSDFCHWGNRFSYQPLPPPAAAPKETTNNMIKIHEFIEQLDRRGMDLIQMKKPGAFAEYLKETKNTICGRHAIAVWLHAMAASDEGDKIDVTFLRYAQSSKAASRRDSSVSYAAAKATLAT